MDLPSSPVYELSRPFTLLSASSPCYSLPPNRQGVLSGSRRGAGGAGRGSGGPREETTEREASVKDNMAAKTQPGPNFLPPREERPTAPPAPQAPPSPGQRRQNGAVSDAGAEPGGEQGASGGVSGQVGGDGGMTDSRKLNLTSWSERGGGASLEEGRQTGEFSVRRGGTTLRRAESLETRVEGRGGRGLFRALNYDPSGLRGEEGRMGAELSRANLALERAGGVQSLPTRLRLQAGSGLRDAGTPGTRSQSIWERIERLYGSEKAEDSNPRTKLYSAPIGDWPLSELDGGGAFAQRRKSTTDFIPNSSPISQWRRGSWSSVSVLGRERAPGVELQGQAQRKPPKLGQIAQRRGVLEYNTRSLDRARSKLTVAAPSRADRSVAREGSITEDVFEPSPQRSTAQPSDRRVLVAPSVASVKNKIHQFETLTQKTQRDFQKPRRAFSVPEPLDRKAGEGASKAGRGQDLGGRRGRWEGVKEERDGVDSGGERMRRTTGNEVKRSAPDQALGGLPGRGEEEKEKERGWADKMEIPLSGGIRERPRRASPVDETSSSQPAEPERPFTPQGRNRRKEAASIKLLNFNNNCNSSEIAELQHSPSPDLSSPVSDDDKTPTNTPHDSPFYPQEDSPFYLGGGSPAFTPTAQPHTSSQETNSHLERDSLVPPLPLSSPSSLPQTGGDLDAWVASLSRKIERWDCGEEDDEEGTEKDEDSNYDSDESSVTITSNMSQSDRRSFCLSLAELCNFGGVDYETEAELEDWPPGRSASLSSDVSALSCVSVLDSEELDRLLDDVRSLGDDTLQNYEDVQVVVLHKEVGIGLGFTVAGGEDQNKPVTVHRVFSSGVAAQEGSIREGDLVLSINGTSLSGSTHWQALRTLRKARTLGMGVVVLRRCVASKPVKGVTGADMQGRKQTPPTNTGETPPTNTGQRLCVRLEKGSRDLGFSLEGGLGCSLGDRPLSVQKIFLGGPVNKVCPGDEVLEIQGVSVVGMRRLEAWNLIRRLPPGPVDVLLHRPLNTSVIHSQSS
ncbi:uncharacterized protein si:dkey-92i15.4 [Osmerus mordax]|uniref:uncharacterized protein si:dkey-92i15.4 n=1 Tax=Osmerus mordax TaxID=8014 RepID=UPI00350EFE84